MVPFQILPILQHRPRHQRYQRRLSTWHKIATNPYAKRSNAPNTTATKQGATRRRQANQKAAPSPFLDCRLLKRLRFTLTSSRLAWLLLSWLRPDLSLML